MWEFFQSDSLGQTRVSLANLGVWSILGTLRAKGESAAVAPHAGPYVRDPIRDISITASAHDVLERTELRRSRTIGVLSCCRVRSPRHDGRRMVVVTSSSYG